MAPAPDRPSREAFVLALAAALHRYGIPAHRLEARMADVAERVGLEGQFFSTPTALTAGFGPLGAQSVRLIRIEPGTVDLSKLLELDRLTEAVAAGQLDPDAGAAAVRTVDARPPLYGPALSVAAFATVSAGAARIFGGGAAEIATAAGTGALAGALGVWLGGRPQASRLFELLAAASVTFGVAAVQAAGIAVAPYVAILAGLIVLIPGLTLTVAVTELATKHLVSGSARLVSAGLAFLQIGFGVALGQQVAKQLWGPLAQPEVVPLPAFTEPVALVVTAGALVVLFQAPRSLTAGVLLATAVALLGARFGRWLLSPELGASVGALGVALLGNAYARWRRRPAVALIVPGLLLLVPGSLGFRSVQSLLARDATVGIEAAFTMGLVAVAIVAGLLTANVLLPPSPGRQDSASL